MMYLLGVFAYQTIGTSTNIPNASKRFIGICKLAIACLVSVQAKQ